MVNLHRDSSRPWARGTPGDTGGPPRDTGGPPRDTEGPPRDTGGPPKDTGGPPRDTGGPPRDHQGTTKGHRGTPGDHRGTPGDHRGTPGDHRGTTEGHLEESAKLLQTAGPYFSHNCKSVGRCMSAARRCRHGQSGFSSLVGSAFALLAQLGCHFAFGQLLLVVCTV